MSLGFPNTSRTYDQGHHRIRFTGHDGVIQIAFFLEPSAIERIGRRSGIRDEANALDIFDKNIDRIHTAASKAYKGTRRHTYLLTASDF